MGNNDENLGVDPNADDAARRAAEFEEAVRLYGDSTETVPAPTRLHGCLIAWAIFSAAVLCFMVLAFGVCYAYVH